ncbi:MAG: hypothetical protein LBJ70_05705 [Holosporales bacterium]|jgi:hypothetical protein|nr:hypothetical protein [Holosporales bacterium]
MSASSVGTLLTIEWNTMNLTDKHFRELIVQQSFEGNSRDFGVFELDERSFGAKRGRSVARKTPVFVAEEGGVSVC